MRQVRHHINEGDTHPAEVPYDLILNNLEFNIESAAYAEDVIIDPMHFPEFFGDELGPCVNCDGVGHVPNVIRSYKETLTTKDQALIDVLSDHDDIGRLVIYAGFTASIDRCINMVKDQNWDYIKLDGRGWTSSFDLKPKELILRFQDKSFDGKIAFIGNPGSAGTGLTLTASPTIVYFSNDFNADSRSQSEDRIHRLGMDENRGATILDLIHLPTDEYVIDNLQAKKRLQDMSLGTLQEVSEKQLERSDYE
jgi:SNF2 family DNA or RNA helicase